MIWRVVERNEISEQEVRFYRAAKATTDWTTASDLARAAKIAPRTSRAYALKFVKLGLFDLAEVWPAHRYRWSSVAAKRNRSYVDRLARAADVFKD